MGDTRERDERNSSKDRRRGRERVGKRKGKEEAVKSGAYWTAALAAD